MKLFSSATDAQKRSAKCAIAPEQADAKADAVLLKFHALPVYLGNNQIKASHQGEGVRQQHALTGLAEEA